MGKDGEDLFRDTPVRYMGYTHEFAEILRPVLHPTTRQMRMCYGASSAYFLMDMAHKATSGYDVASSGVIKALFRLGDVAIFHLCASIIFPRFAVRYVQYGTRQLIQRYKIPIAKNNNLVPIGVGLISLPILSTPMDGIVNVVMNCTYRLIFGR